MNEQMPSIEAVSAEREIVELELQKLAVGPQPKPEAAPAPADALSAEPKPVCFNSGVTKVVQVAAKLRKAFEPSNQWAIDMRNNGGKV